MSSRSGSPSTEVHEGVRSRPGTYVPRLTVVSGPAQGRAFAMTAQLATIGRHPTNDLVIADPAVSGVHLRVRRGPERLVLRDAGSTNGSWLGPHRIVELEVDYGAEIRVGSSVIRIDVDVDASEGELSARERFGGLVGRSASMRELFSTLERIAPTDVGVLIEGETGTGKEELARALHGESPRRGAPFVVVDATSLPDTMAESLLFGHEPGAVAGSSEGRVGYFEAAEGGTVFLDEIGELSSPLQAKFLRVLERREVTRVGASGSIPVNVRILAATNRDLRHEIEAGRFREDLYFRLATMRVFIPALRDRAEDIPLLADHLLAQLAGADGGRPRIEDDALLHLGSQPWPGNVRELRNAVTRAAALSKDGIIRRVDVAAEGSGFRGSREERDVIDVAGKFSDAKDRAIERFESAYLSALMKRCGGNLSQAAREADIARHHLRDLLKKRGLYGIDWGEQG